MKTIKMMFCMGALWGCQPAFTGPEPAYEGCATDEHWILMDRTAERGGAAGAPLWLEPGDGATLSPSLPAAFRYQPSAASAGSPDGDAACGHFRAPTAGAGDAGGTGPRHLPPVSGTIYDLRFQVAGQTAYRVLTTRQSARVPAAIWAGWAGQRVQADLRAARLFFNEVLDAPVAAPPRQVLLSPLPEGPEAP